MTTWTPHRTKHPRKCDRCPPSGKAAWVLTIRGTMPQYLCDFHATAAAANFGIAAPPSRH